MNDDIGFASPPFKADAALLKVRRELSALGLSEREGRFEQRGLVVARAKLEGEAILAARVRRPSRTSPEWQERRLRNDAEVRDFVAALKKAMSHWSDRDD